jgi:hypothetical protein
MLRCVAVLFQASGQQLHDAVGQQGPGMGVDGRGSWGCVHKARLALLV